MAASPPASHPYHPPDAAIPGYAPNETPVAQLLAVFGAVVVAVCGAAYGVAAVAARDSSSRSRTRLRPVDRFAVVWFALCGFLHVAFEGYYIYNRRSIAGMNTLFAQLWKEYAISDSRYLTSDVFTVCVETITVLAWGPLCWLTLAAIVSGSRSRHACQAVVCTAHLYGVALYYLTSWAEHRFRGVSHSRPEFLYFWVYYVGFNLPWAVVPVALLYDSFTQVAAAFEALEEQGFRRKNA